MGFIRCRIGVNFRDGDQDWSRGEIGMFPEGHPKTEQFLRTGFIVYDDTTMKPADEKKLNQGIKLRHDRGYKLASEV